MTSNNSPCGTASPCASPVAERPRYFPRQIITPDDLTLEQEYFRNKLRRHNRLMHGWGVVCGAQVCVTPQTDASGNLTSSYQPWMVTVTAGYILGPYGDEILLDCCRTIDLRTTGASGMTGDPCVQVPDPWCTSVYVQRDPTAPLYVAVKYKECKTRPVRVQPAGCGCSDNTCEYSRLQDGYEIGILTSCSDSGATPPSKDTLLTGSTPDCPTCPSQPWVVLAKVTVDTDGNVTTIDDCACRRIVASFGNFWWQCTNTVTSVSSITSTATDLTNVPAGTTGVTAAVTFGAVLDPTTLPTADLGPGINITSFTPSSATNTTTWTLIFDVAPTAAAGSRTLTVATKTGDWTLANAVTVTAAAPSATASAAKKAKTAATKTPAPAPAADTTAGSDAPAADTKKKN